MLASYWHWRAGKFDWFASTCAASRHTWWGTHTDEWIGESSIHRRRAAVPSMQAAARSAVELFQELFIWIKSIHVLVGFLIFFIVNTANIRPTACNLVYKKNLLLCRRKVSHWGDVHDAPLDPLVALRLRKQCCQYQHFSNFWVTNSKHP